MIKMVCFDLDGTIADTIPLCLESFRKATSSYAGHILSDAEIIQLFGMNEVGMIKCATGDKWRAALEDFYTYYESMHDMCMAPFQGIRELIEELDRRNIWITMITGKGIKSCNITINKLQMNHCFCEYITGLEKGSNKSEGIAYLIDKYHLQLDEFVYVGDAVSDVMACKNANVQCLSAAWAKSADVNSLNTVNFEKVFTNVFDLREYIIGC